MSTILITLITTIIGLGIATLIVPGVKANSFLTFVIAAIVLGIINVFIRPVLWVITAPLSVLSFGLFILIINALMISLTAALVPGFEVKGFGSSFLAAVLMAMIGLIAIVIIALLTGADVSWSTYEYHTYTP